MTIRNRPDELLTTIVDALRAGLADIVDEVNADALGRKNWALPAFSDANIDLALQPERLPEWTEEPTILVVLQSVSSSLASPPTLSDRKLLVVVRAYLQHSAVVEADPLPRVESEEATLSGALSALSYAVERCLMRLFADGGIWGAVGVDDVVPTVQTPQIHQTPNEGQILHGTVDVFLELDQEGLT